MDNLSPNFMEFAGHEPPLVSFVTVSYKMDHFVRHLLQGFQDANPRFSYEYFLVDNASNDQTVAMVKERFPWVRVIASDKNVGFGAGNNLAIRQARGKYVVLLNPDLTIFPNEIEKWVEWMEARPEVGISGPRLLNPDGTDQESCYRFPSLFVPVYRRTLLGKTEHGKKTVDQYLMRGIDRSQVHDVDWVMGAAMMIRRDVLDRVGTFDERFFMYLEDTDLCRRAWAANARVCYTPAARFVHYHKRESRTRHVWDVFRNRVTRMHIKSAIKYFLKYRGDANPRGV